ncbi:hypothetical protein [Cellulomonas dongxiuzhuiae]|uniref:Uncharacterized protein n=1 Tax=Cellulomonas dongxiuzhuiae TaxID=2819979 RepID=A0ABX8GLV0_9CELL|nr:hypothetical protein [Cellulomonas dongxiuzhuiae]MBO3095847.1 hypothetical protein [Cellulomonas dongxiuzhuiae]QWC17153.1 hypothetical protein KKR89_06005 [Cellulomonas dongxiuzhuiae]
MSHGLRSRRTAQAVARGVVPLRPTTQTPHDVGEPEPSPPPVFHPHAPPFDPIDWPGPDPALAYARAVGPRLGLQYPGPLAAAARFAATRAGLVSDTNAQTFQ